MSRIWQKDDSCRNPPGIMAVARHRRSLRAGARKRGLLRDRFLRNRFQGVLMLDTFATADLYDEYGETCQSCETQFVQYGGRRVFGGRIRTIRCLGDNALVRETLNTPSEGEVLVIDGGGSMASALMGDLIAAAGQRNGWAGAVILGPVRDTGALAQMDFGVKALGSNPRKSAK